MRPLLLRVKGPLEVELYVRRSDCRVMQVMGETHTVIEKVSPRTGFTDHLIKTDVTPELKKELRDKGVRVINLGIRGYGREHQAVQHVGSLRDQTP